MKAMRSHKFGASDVLVFEDAPKPQPGKGDLLVRVYAAGTNPIDFKTRAGQGVAGRLSNPFPLIVGWDISGVVEAIGSNVTNFAVGDEVFSMPRFPDLAEAYAEYVVVPSAEAAHKPHSLDHLQAAALPLAGLTAWQALFNAGGLETGQRALIHAAAGGVGHIAVQLAKWKGATVFGTASAHNEQFLHNMGVDEFINYQTTNFEDVAQNIDLVLDSMSGETRQRSWQTLKKDGILVSILDPASEETAAEYGVRTAKILVQPNGSQLAELAKLVDAGYVSPAIDTVFSLKDAGKAHQRLEQKHTRGKIVLQVV